MRAEKAWVRAYRALEHGFAKNVCKEAKNLVFPPGIVLCANDFVELQEARHRADYDPRAQFSLAEELSWVARAEAAIRELRAELRRDRKAFAVTSCSRNAIEASQSLPVSTQDVIWNSA